MTRALVFSLCLIAPFGAQAQPVVVRDQWLETWANGRKSSWTHIEIHELPQGPPRGPRFVVLRKSWVARTGKVFTVRSRAVTDSRAVLLELERVRNTRHGQYHTRVETRADGLHWSYTVRNLPTRTGTITEELTHLDVLALRLCRGEIPPGDHEVRTLELGGMKQHGFDSERVSFQAQQDGTLLWTNKSRRSWFRPTGALVRQESLAWFRTETLPATGAAQAGDQTRKRPSSQPDVAGWKGVTLRRPAGPEWHLGERRKGRDRSDWRWGLRHSSRASLMVMPFLVPPKDPDQRRVWASQIQASLNKTGYRWEHGYMRLEGKPVVEPFRGRPAVRFAVEVRRGSELQRGSAWLIDSNGSGWLLLNTWPEDLAPIAKPYAAEALAALSLAKPTAAAPKTVRWDRYGLQLQVPGTWERVPGENAWATPDRFGKVELSLIPTEGKSLTELQRLWLAQLKKGKLQALKVVQQGPQPLGGQPGQRVVLEGPLKSGAMDLQVRLVWHVIPMEDGQKAMVILGMAFQPGVEHALLDRVLASARWARSVTALDQWFELYQGSRKLGWSRTLILERPDASPARTRFVAIENLWIPVLGGVVHRRSRIETDLHSQVLGGQSTTRTPQGDEIYETTRIKGGLAWQSRIRNNPLVRGEFTAAPAYSIRILTHLIITGRVKAGTRRLTVLRVFGAGVEQRVFACQPEGSGRWKWEDGRERSTYSADGAALSTAHSHMPGYAALPATAAVARDMKRERSAPRSTHTYRGIAASLPGGPGWFMTGETREGVLELDLMHAVGVSLRVAGPISVVPPADPATRKALGTQFMKGANRTPGSRFSQVTPVTFLGRPAVRYRLVQSGGGVPARGEAWLVNGGNETGWVVYLTSPADLYEQTAALRSAALKALRITPRKAPPPRPVQFPTAGLTLLVPPSWKKSAAGRYSTRDRMGHLMVEAFALGNQTLEAAQRAWLDQVRTWLATHRVVDSGSATLGGRDAHRVVLEGTAVNQGVTFKVRCYSYMVDLDGTAAVNVLLMGVEGAFDLKTLDRIAESASWDDGG